MKSHVLLASPHIHCHSCLWLLSILPQILSYAASLMMMPSILSMYNIWGMSLQILERVDYRHAWQTQIIKGQRKYVPIQSIPPGRKAIQCKWVLHIKRNKINTISHFKTQLIVKGFTQIPRQNFHYTFASIAHWDSIHAILSVATINDYKLCQLNIKTTYLNGPLDEEIYMQAPPGLIAPFWHLYKGLYGLRQARRRHQQKCQYHIYTYNALTDPKWCTSLVASDMSIYLTINNV